MSVRTLGAYLFFGLLIGLPFIPLLFFINGKNYPFKIWYAIDVFICTIAHGTHKRTISGWTGQHMNTHKRFHYQAKLIDWLLRKCGDKRNHCFRAYHSELLQGLVSNG